MMCRRIDSIQGLRAIAFLAIFMSHSRLLGLGFLGAWGVSIFFVLSGFLMVYNYYPKIDYTFPPAYRFAWQKIRKLYPLHILMTVACVLYTILNEEKIPANLPIVTLLHTLLLQIWIPNSVYYETLNGVAWYLCVCAFTYFCFPLILKELRKVRNKRETILIMGGGTAFQVLVSIIAYSVGTENKTGILTMQWITYYFPISRLADFFIGCCIGALFIQNSHQKPMRNALSCMLQYAIPVILVVCFWIYHSGSTIFGQENIKYTLLFLPTTCLIVYLSACKGTIYSCVLSNRILIKIGNLSPYAFLIHSVAIKYLYAANHILLQNKVSPFIIVMFAFAITMFTSEIWKIMAARLQGEKRRNEKNNARFWHKT